MRRAIVSALFAIPLVLGSFNFGRAQMVGVVRPQAPSTLSPKVHGTPVFSRGVFVTGTAQISGPPNVMIASFDVETAAPSVSECTFEQAKKTKQLMRALRSLAGTQAKITALGFTLFPYNRPTTLGRVKPVGWKWVFVATVVADTDSVPLIGKVIDAAMAAGATGVEGTGFRYVGPGGYGQRPSKREPYAQIAVKVTCASATECTARGSRITDHVKLAIENVLDGKGTIQVSTFQLNRTAEYQQPHAPQRKDFQAHTTVLIETSNFGLLGAIMTTALRNGAERLELVQFTLSKDSSLTRKAIEEATQDVKAKAAMVAKAMGVKLGRVINISSDVNISPQNIYTKPGLPYSLTPPREPPQTIQPGYVGLNARVSVTYEMEK